MPAPLRVAIALTCAAVAFVLARSGLPGGMLLALVPAVAGLLAVAPFLRAAGEDDSREPGDW